MSTKKEAITSLVVDGQQAVVIVLFAKNSDGTPLRESQINLARDKARNELEEAHAEVEAQSTALFFDPTAKGEIAKLVATLKTIVPGNEPEEEPTEVDDAAEEPEPESEE